MTATPDRTETIFAAAVALSAAAERAALLDRECADDPGLRNRIEGLLRAHDQADHLLDRPISGGIASTQTFHSSEHAGMFIAGRYKLLEAIGEGGMGTVWVAEQTEPVRRKVALKLIKAGMDSKSVLARFEAERQALAMMNHPNIAKVLEGGLTAPTDGGYPGRPFFVMEYVKGASITEYCDATRLSVHERLNLFVQVCHAVQHAHQKGIIHRDLKPSNILVAPYDDRPVPKVIDFGLAKAMHQPLTERTLHTAHETVLGTPLYMSPEQAQLNNIDVDTRSDIYSLGVLLYELLTGTTPLEKQRFKEAAWDEIMRIIREEEPPRPSMRLSSTDTLPSLAAGRQIEPARLKKLVRGELDWIVMKSLEKDRSRRYEAANDLAADVQRYLAGEPVLAAPPGSSYLLRKFVRKHRVTLMTAATIALLLVSGIAVSTWQAQRAMRAEAAALQALGDKEEARKAEAQQRRQAEDNAQIANVAEAKARAVSEFLQNDLLGQADTNLQADRHAHADVKPDLTVREALDRAAANLGRFSNGQELTEAELRLTIGNAYMGIGDARRAVPHLERCREIRAAKLGADHSATLDAIHALGIAYTLADRAADARKVLEELLPVAEAKLGKDHVLTIACLGHLAIALSNSGRRNEALSLFEEALRRARTALGPDHDSTLNATNNLAVAYDQSQRMNDALPLFEQVLHHRRAKLGASHPDTQLALNNLGTCYWRLGHLDRSVPLFEEAYRLRKEKMGTDHPLTIRTQANLGINYSDIGRPREAIPLLEEAMQRGRPLAGREGINLPGILEALAEAHTQVGEHGKAESLLRELYEFSRKIPGDNRADAASWQARLGLNLLQQTKFVEAESLLRSAIAVRAQLEPDDWRTFNTQSLLGGALLGQKKYADAEPLLLAGYEGMKQREATIPLQGRIRLLEALDRLIELYTVTDKPDEVTKWKAERFKYPPPAPSATE